MYNNKTEGISRNKKYILPRDYNWLSNEKYIVMKIG